MCFFVNLELVSFAYGGLHANESPTAKAMLLAGKRGRSAPAPTKAAPPTRQNYDRTSEGLHVAKSRHNDGQSLEDGGSSPPLGRYRSIWRDIIEGSLAVLTQPNLQI